MNAVNHNRSVSPAGRGRRWLSAILIISALGSPISSPAAGPSLELEKRAGKVVLIDFWASWCVPCRMAFPWMWTMIQRYGAKGFVIIAVNLDKDDQPPPAFLADFPAMDLQTIRDPDAVLAKEWKVEAMPTAFLIDKKGKLRYTHKGFLADDIPNYEAHIAELVNE